MNVTDAIRRIDEWHFEYARKLIEAHKQIGTGKPIEIPRYAIRLRGTKWAGQYSYTEQQARYSLPYALMHPDKIEETVAHELCHAWQRAILPGCDHPHDNFFLFLIRNVCGHRTAGFYHYMNTRGAKALGQVLLLKLPHDRDGCYTGAMPHQIELADAACTSWRTK